ncbi:hypothetical protein H0V99_00010 [Candidatus Saccharibacteria bacterium]|nr:hypothetical protein [Candidatus Saccharibacteria bacterium]
MSNTGIALLVAVSASAWIYSKMMRSTGGNVQSSIIVSAVAAIFLFAITFIIAGMLPG